MTNAVATANKRRGRPKSSQPKTRHKRKDELTRPPVTVMSATASWSREQMAAEMGLSLAAYDDRYRRGADMPPRYKLPGGSFWRHLIVDYQQWQRQAVAKAAAEAERKHLGTKRDKRAAETATASLET
jgi:hypothetical protein